MKFLPVLFCLAQIVLATNGPEMVHQRRPAVDHSSSLLMAPPIQRIATPIKRKENAKSSLEGLAAASSFKSLRDTVVSLCPHPHNDTRACSGASMCVRRCGY